VHANGVSRLEGGAEDRLISSGRIDRSEVAERRPLLSLQFTVYSSQFFGGRDPYFHKASPSQFPISDFEFPIFEYLLAQRERTREKVAFVCNSLRAQFQPSQEFLNESLDLLK
jgi:hypothetical protein